MAKHWRSLQNRKGKESEFIACSLKHDSDCCLLLVALYCMKERSREHALQVRALQSSPLSYSSGRARALALSDLNNPPLQSSPTCKLQHHHGTPTIHG